MGFSGNSGVYMAGSAKKVTRIEKYGVRRAANRKSVWIDRKLPTLTT